MIVRRLAALPRRRQRVIAISTAAAVLVTLGFALAVPILDRHRHYDDAIDGSLLRIERLRDSVGRIPELEAEFEARRAALRSADLFLREASDSLASAQLQQVLRDYVDEANGTTDSTAVLEPRDRAGFRQVMVRARFTGDAETLRQFLHAAESARPFLMVEDLTVQPEARRRRGRSENEPVVLSIQADVSALRAPGAMLQADGP